MIPSANLSDFEQKELILLTLAVEEKLKSCQNNIETLLKFDDSEFKTNQLAYWKEHSEIYQLWLTQIGNARLVKLEADLAKSN